jgi:CcmD family protein
MAQTTTSQPTPPAAGSATTSPPPTEFVPVQGGGTSASGEFLMVVAYIAIWLIAFAFIVTTWLKQRRLDGRIAQLEGDLARARREPARK